jgi:hypothetical protein
LSNPLCIENSERIASLYKPISRKN